MSNPLGERPGVTRGQLASGAVSIPASAINGANNFVGVLDELYAEGVTPIFAASTSRLLGWPFNTGDSMARIRRASDNLEADFSYVGLPPRLNFAGIDTHVSATTGRFRTWHNQCGTLLCGNAVQTIDANQPLYVQNEGPDFNGTSYRMLIDHSANQLLTGGWTFACSINPDDLATAGRMLVNKSANLGLSDGFGVYVGNANAMRVRVNGTPNVDSTADFTTGAWQHLIVTCSAAGAVTFYRNNVAAGTGTANACSGITSTNPLRIGADFAGTASFWDGGMDDYFIIPGVVSADARAILYAGRSY
jgi:hypothetical protein